ncbi:MAG: tRNA uracil 4-sulfurtransferase ThiI [Promethearchaeota archaeon]
MSNSFEPDKVLVRYGEIGLKSLGIRRYLETLLRNHLRIMLTRSGTEYSKITRERGRFFIHTSNTQSAAHAASRVFGVVSTSPVWTTSSKPTKIVKLAKQLAPQILSEGQSFAVRARRLKTHPFTSQEIATQVGAAIIEVSANKQTPISVDLDNPDVEVHIEIREKFTYLFTEIIKGPGGLPYGSQGTVVGLHSGGIDSPVAQWLMMKRGARVIPLYFDTDLPDEKGLRIRAIQSATRLTEWIPVKKKELLIVPYYEILHRLQMPKYPKITCILCKRMMYRMSAMVAAQEDATAIVTGETLGQVASQTLTNLTILDSAVALPIFRPLIGMDKTETMEIARQIGTYDVSSKDVGKCFAVPKQPSIAAQLNLIHEAESKLAIAEMVTSAVSQLERVALEK